MLVKLPGPVPCEINGIHQDQLRLRIEHPCLDEVGDFTLGLVSHPIIDFRPGGIRAGAKINLLQIGAIALFRHVQKSGEKRFFLLRPQSVGDIQFNPNFLLLGVQLCF